jgi:hypothetical protein
MTSPTDVCNLALLETGSRVSINSLTDNTPQAIVANQFYTPKIQALMRAAAWVFLRKTLALTQLKAAVVNGQPSSNPPPQPFLFEYAYPSDCLRARFLIPYQTPQPSGSPPLTTAPNVAPFAIRPPTSVPFVVGSDTDSNGNPIRVILTNMYQALLIYDADLSQMPDLWDPMFLSAATAFLASYFITALARNKDQLAQQVGIVKSVLDQARAVDGNEAILNNDHLPDWMAVRLTGYGYPYGGWGVGASTTGWGWDACSLADGLSY